MWEIPAYYGLKRNGGKLSHGPAKRYDAGTRLKAAVRQEYADSNQVKVNDDGKFNNDVAGTRGVYQAGIRSSFTPTLSGHLSVSYGNGAGVESPWNTQAGVVWTF